MASWRGHAGTGIAAEDICETLAFTRATATTRTVLLHPRRSDVGPALPVGSVEVCERVVVGAEEIIALTVECRGISATDGYGQFARRLSSAVQQHIVQAVTRETRPAEPAVAHKVVDPKGAGPSLHAGEAPFRPLRASGGTLASQRAADGPRCLTRCRVGCLEASLHPPGL